MQKQYHYSLENLGTQLNRRWQLAYIKPCYAIFLSGGVEDLEAHECKAEVDSGAPLDGDGGKCEPASEAVRESARKISSPKATAVEEELRMVN